MDGLGFLLNDEMDDFASKMGVPNGFGLIQGPANAIAAGQATALLHDAHHRERAGLSCDKNGRHGMARPGKLRLVLGSPGGSTIITTVANDLISVIDNGLDIQAAADAPRFHHQYLPDVLQFEKAFPVDVVNALKATGLHNKARRRVRREEPRHLGRQRTDRARPKNRRTYRRPR